jgi:hypothetical protein
VYNGSLAGSGGVFPVTVSFGWCNGFVSSIACNATNWSLTITGDGGSCITGFNAWIGPVQIVNEAPVFQLWGAEDGVIATVSVTCDRAGQQGKATLTGFIVNHPVSSYTFTFSSIHGCGSS